MDFTITQWIEIIGCILGVCIFYELSPKFEVKKHAEKAAIDNLYGSDYSVLIGYLDWLMDTEMKFVIELPYEGKEVKRVSDFESTLPELTQSVVAGINDIFIDKAKNIGISESYIYEYITRGCTVRLLNYMKETNTGIKTDESKEEE